VPVTSSKGALPVDAREALHWFVNNFGLYIGSTRGLFITDWGEEHEATLEAAIINLKSRGFTPVQVTGDTLYKQADYLWKESRANTAFGRPLASKLELELSGSDIVIVDSLEAPENSRHLWYIFSHLLYPRAIAGKATIVTTPLTFSEFVRYGEACPDPDFCSKGINWEKLLWLIEASMISLDTFKLCREEGLPPMLKSEHQLYTALKERNLNVVPQHVLGDFMLDFALIEKEHRLNIECDTVGPLGGSEIQRQEAKRNLVLLSDGWQVLKFTTSEVLGNKSACADVVDDVWRSGRKRGATGRLLTGNTVAPMPDLPVDDDVQLAAITYGGGPAAVAGGAGTGKTTCIVQRVAYLLGQNVNPDNILVLTYNTDTQRSMKRTLEAIVEKQAFQRLTISSWHDFGLKVLKENLPAIKRKPPLKIEPSPQKIIQRLLTKAKKEIDPAKLELSVDLDEFYIAAVISMYKSHLISPKQAKEEAGTYGEEIIAKIYQQLEDQLQKANRIDRDDVVAMTVQVLVENPEVRSRLQRQFEFVLVDEYQDVTVAQDMLARLLSAPQDNLFVVGDEDETIAEAKNACPELFTEWSLRIPHARCHILERNWRSHPAIVDHARQLLTGLTKKRMNKEFISAWGQAPASAIIGPTIANDEQEEANWVANEIQLLVDSGRNYGDIAILYRHHVYATILEEALDNKGVRYQSSNPINNFVPDEVSDMMAFLRLVIDPDGPRARESFERVCQLRAREVDPKLSATIASFAEANNLSYLKAVEIYSEATNDSSCQELQQLVRIIRTMHQEKLPPTETIALIRRTQRLNDYYRSVKIPPGVNYEPTKKLTALEEESRGFKTTADFVKHISGQQVGQNGTADSGVQVLPILDSRGLEFPVVFMVGMAEGIFPSQTTIDLEEERRICYVGFTRAKDLLYLSYPVMFSGAMLQPSHFLVDARLMVAPPPMVPMQEQQVYEQPVQPVYEQPVQPVYEQPVYQEPVYQQAAYQEPVQPAYQQPVYQEPVYQEPAPQPVYQEPVYQEPVYQEPVYQEPAPQPVYQEPVYQEPVYQEPVHQEPAPQPVYQEPVYQEPVYQEPVYQEPAPEPVYEEPPAEEMVQVWPPPEAELAPIFEPPVVAEQPAPEPAPVVQPEPVAPVEPAKPALPEPTPLPEAPRSRPGRQSAAAAAAAAAAPVDPFQIYTAPEHQAAPPPMPSLPKSKSAAAAAAAGVQQEPKVETPSTPEKHVAKPGFAPRVSAPAAETTAPQVVPAALTPQAEPAADSWDYTMAWQLSDNEAPAAQAPASPAAKAQPMQPHQPEPHTISQPQPAVPPPQPVVQQPAPQPVVQQPAVPAMPTYQQPQPAPEPVYQAPVQPQPAPEYVHPAEQQPSQPVRHYEQMPYQPQYEPPTQHAQPEHVSDGVHPMCPSCYNPLEAHARFCGECGYTLPERVPACPTCAAPLEITAKFCGECGMELQSPNTSSSNVSDNLRRMQGLKEQQQGWMNKLFKTME
jgi:DNA helicase II / ATP-dependent DNA helicase PcrA